MDDFLEYLIKRLIMKRQANPSATAIGGPPTLAVLIGLMHSMPDGRLCILTPMRTIFKSSICALRQACMGKRANQ